MTTNGTYNDYFPSRWIKADDIPENKNLVLTVEDVNFEPVGQDKEMRLVLHFAEREQGLVLNKTNAQMLEQLFGHNPNNAIGKRIALMAVPVTYAGKTMMGIRISPQLPKQPAPVEKVNLTAAVGFDEPSADEDLPEPEFDDSWAG